MDNAFEGSKLRSNPYYLNGRAMMAEHFAEHRPGCVCMTSIPACNAGTRAREFRLSREPTRAQGDFSAPLRADDDPG